MSKMLSSTGAGRTVGPHFYSRLFSRPLSLLMGLLLNYHYFLMATYSEVHGPTEDPASEFRLEVAAIAKNLNCPKSEVDNVVQDVILKYQTMRSMPFLIKVISNRIKDLYRVRRTEPIEPGLGEPQVEPYDPTENGVAPLIVIEERLRLLHARNTNPPHVAMACALCAHLGKRPEQVVSDFQRIPLRLLGDVILQEYSALSRIPSAILEKRMPVMLQEQGEASESCLSDYWDPLLILKDWLQSPLPDGAPPNLALTWIFHDRLGYTKEQILLIADGALEDLALRAAEELARAERSTLADIRGRYPGLSIPVGKDGKKYERSLRSYFQPAKTVSHWVQSAMGRFRSAELAQESEGIALLTPALPGRDALAFINHYLLRTYLSESVDQLAVRLAGTSVTVKNVLDGTAESIAHAWTAPLSVGKTCLGPLRDQLRQEAGESFAAGRGRAVIASWIAAKVRPRGLQILREELGRRRGPVLFAWRHDLLPALVNSGKRKP